MAKRVGLSSVEFVQSYVKLVKEGKSATEIGTAMGLKGDAKEVAQKVSARTTQLRKVLKAAAIRSATEQGLSKEDQDTLVKTMEDKLPRIKGRKQSGVAEKLVAAIDSVLAALDNK